MGFASHRGLRRVASFRPFKSVQVGDTGPAESTRQGNLQRVGLLFLGSRDSQNYSGHKCGTGRKRPNSCDLRAQELSSATKDSDGRKQAAIRKPSARDATGARYGSCRRVIRPAIFARPIALGDQVERPAPFARSYHCDQVKQPAPLARPEHPVIKSSSQRLSRGQSIL